MSAAQKIDSTSRPASPVLIPMFTRGRVQSDFLSRVKGHLGFTTLQHNEKPFDVLVLALDSASGWAFEQLSGLHVFYKTSTALYRATVLQVRASRTHPQVGMVLSQFTEVPSYMPVPPELDVGLNLSREVEARWLPLFAPTSRRLLPLPPS